MLTLKRIEIQMMGVICHMAFISAFLTHGDLYGQNCIDPTLINPDAICNTQYDPVCGCDGNTYSNACVAVNSAGVTSWIPGECNGGLILADPCTDVSNVNFGLCTAFLGYALINGQCAPVSGCGYVVDNIDYSPAFSATLEGCNTDCGQLIIVDQCTDVAGVDFGPCDMFLGYALVNGVCTGISGCGYTVDDYDYTASFVQTLDECNTLCAEITPSEACTDLTNIDFGECSTILGIGIVNGSCTSISGCSNIVGTTDYTTALYDNIDNCESCLTNNLIPQFQNRMVNIQPNPFTDEMILTLIKPTMLKIYIHDLSGRQLFEFNANGEKITLRIPELQTGTYLITIENQSFRLSRPIIRQ